MRVFGGAKMSDGPRRANLNNNVLNLVSLKGEGFSRDVGRYMYPCKRNSVSIGIEDSNHDGKFILGVSGGGDKLVLNGRPLSYDNFIRHYNRICEPKDSIFFDRGF